MTAWPTAPLGEVSPARPLANPAIVSCQHVWQLNLDSIEPGTGNVISKTRAPIKEAGTSTHWFDERNVLYSKLRPYLNKVVVPDEQGIATTELVPLRPDPARLNRKFLAYYLRSAEFVHWVGNQTAGAKMPRVSMKLFWAHEAPLPPLEEQQRITAILDKADAIRRKRQQATDLANEFLRSVFLDMFGDPGSNPKSWDMGTIRDLAAEVKYGTSAKAGSNGEFEILRMGNITSSGDWDFSAMKRIDIAEKDRDKYLAHKGDLLFNRTNSKELVGKSAVYRDSTPRAIAGYLIRLRANQYGTTEYIAAYLNSRHGKQVLRTMCKSIVGMANINAQELQEISIAIPPIELQHMFGRIVDHALLLKAKFQGSVDECDQLFDSLSQRAFAGEI